ncbi:hypothetical protein [Microbacterium paraoxydans]|uniref:Uncharacterized protein n=1 Tax=Microbacterium paraoxydans TaxID=199592 RepID=A0A1H1LCY6_9MICO|nr:hypothetical protein [Microbacterium paraoxydans]SDR71885.1 hypothetical protein SAMN04489809_0065 [Microbacterium paraoxydans]
MSDYTPTTEAVESLGEDIQAYLVMDGVYLDHEITRNVARCILSDPDWAGVVAEEPEWEYGWDACAGFKPNPTSSREWAEDVIKRNPDWVLVRRSAAVPAGEWVPVKQEGADDVRA